MLVAMFSWTAMQAQDLIEANELAKIMKQPNTVIVSANQRSDVQHDTSRGDSQEPCTMAAAQRFQPAVEKNQNQKPAEDGGQPDGQQTGNPDCGEEPDKGKHQRGVGQLPSLRPVGVGRLVRAGSGEEQQRQAQPQRGDPHQEPGGQAS